LAIQIDQLSKELTVSGYPSGWVKMLFELIDLFIELALLPMDFAGS